MSLAFQIPYQPRYAATIIFDANHQDRISEAWRSREIANQGDFVIGTKDFEGVQYAESDAELKAEFNERAQRWYKETGALSFIKQKAIHPAYQEIIGMGEKALPLIFAEMLNKRGDWIWALEKIVRNENPARGITNYKDAVSKWVEWGKLNGHIA